MCVTRTMATFCNQSSNLSALSSALTSYSHVLDVSEKATSSLTRAEHQENAAEFLEQQRRRVEAIDAALLKATGHILPPSRDAKTVTELAEICRLVQEATRQKMGLLRTRLDLMGIRPSWHDSVIASPNVVVVDATGRSRDIQWSIGVPLDCVMEGDVETEGATTPGSLLQMSPFPSATKQPQRKTSLTPPTPTMNRFSFSTRTASIIEGMNQPTPGGSAKRPPVPSLGGTTAATPSPSIKRAGPHFKIDGFQDDDDMISLNTTFQDINFHHLSPPAVPTVVKSPLQTMKEERLQFIQRMESMLERVEEELTHESRPSDEISRTSKTNVARNSRSLLQSNRPSDEQSLPLDMNGNTDNEMDIRETNRRMERPSNNKFLDELEEEIDDEDESSSGTDNDEDDSTNLMATLVAEKPEPLRDNIQRPVPVFSRHPTHITVDNGAQSPAHTNITMDATMMMNDASMISGMATMIQEGDDDENGSVMTPVLDRYRLDPDDNSIGVKVVPNQRGMHYRYTHPTLPEVSEQITTNELYEDRDGFTSPKGLPGSVSARKTKQYRKTPYPKKQRERNIEDENHPNTPSPIFSPASSTTSFDASNPESSFSVPPLRPRSFGPSRTLLVGTRQLSTVSTTQSLPVSPMPNTFEREP